jgi:adenylate cyclase
MDFPILADLRADGYTDYVIFPLVYAGSRPWAVSFCTRRPEGFTDLDLAIIGHVLPGFAGALEIMETRRTARQLLETYIGPKAGAQVLAGDILRGQGRTIDAVLWMSDLHDFTRLSNHLPLSDVISLLNRYFDLMAEPIERHGGEILKFVGDAVLAIFPLTHIEEDRRQAVHDAVTAASEALGALDAVNAERRAEGLEPLKTGIALHNGEVMYGNVGSSNRLDFTVIGPAVNLASRLTHLTGELDRSLVLSADFARLVDRPLRYLGRFSLKGFDTPEEVFTVERA